MKIPIEFYFGKTSFIDKLTFILFECMCYDLIYNYGHYVQIFMSIDSGNDIYSDGVFSSPLLLLNRTKREKVKLYPQKFKKELFRRHYRRVLQEKDRENSNYLGDLYQEIDSFLKPFGIEETSRDKVGNVVSELAGNAYEHAGADCLVDIDVAPNYKKVVENASDGCDYYGINIVVVNFSEVLFGDGVYENIVKRGKCSDNERYEGVMLAYENHSKLFSDAYRIEDFCNITTFQHKISGRNENSITGGTGLTKLIRSLAEKSDAYRCYVVSGERAVNFYKEFLEYNNEKWLGFNDENDYITQIPNLSDEKRLVISESLMFMPGTAYNLNFVMKGE